LVLDTNAVASALLWDGPSKELLRVVIGTALAAKADFVVTGDRALLSVGEYEGGRIVSVSEALDAVT
jgi:predicted nucleic acid-binding protein